MDQEFNKNRFLHAAEQAAFMNSEDSRPRTTYEMLRELEVRLVRIEKLINTIVKTYPIPED